MPLHQKIYGVPCAEGNEEKYLETYKKFNCEVIEFFKNKDKFLIMEARKNFDFHTLCDFLSIQYCPNEPFPHERNNRNRKLPNYKLYRDLRSIYWNFKKNY